VVKFSSSKYKDLIFKNVKFLKGKTQFVVQEQFPPEIYERRKRLWPKYKEAKEKSKTDRTVKVSWSLDKLFINGVVHSAKDDSRMIEPDGQYGKSLVKHSPSVTEKNSTFSGHAARLAQGISIENVLADLVSMKDTATADHMIYAYKYGTSSGCCDDGEHGAGTRLLKILNDKKVRNGIVVVTRWFGGDHLGPRRFELIQNCAADAIKLAFDK
jgi:hypothetical protein